MSANSRPGTARANVKALFRRAASVLVLGLAVAAFSSPASAAAADSSADESAPERGIVVHLPDSAVDAVCSGQTPVPLIADLTTHVPACTLVNGWQ